MTFSEAIKTCFSKYATFSGRAIRSEYWWFTLFLFLGGFALGLVDAVLFSAIIADASPISSLFSLATFIPALAVTARRLHDSNRSGWWQIAPMGAFILTALLSVSETYILAFAAGAFAIVSVGLLLFWLIKRGDVGANQYGPGPFDRRPPGHTDTYSESSIPRVE